jgi:hypothetical protein
VRGHRTARGGYHVRSIERAKRLGDDRELAKSYRAPSQLAARCERPEISRQSEIPRALSDEIFHRHEVRAA